MHRIPFVELQNDETVVADFAVYGVHTHDIEEAWLQGRFVAMTEAWCDDTPQASAPSQFTRAVP